MHILNINDLIAPTAVKSHTTPPPPPTIHI